jgi:hypothetical protein
MPRLKVKVPVVDEDGEPHNTTLEAPIGAYNVEQLRAILSEAIDNLRRDRITPSNANAISNACGKIVSTVRLQMEYGRQTGKPPRLELLESE